MPEVGDDARVEDVLRKAGEWGGVWPLAPCKELKEVRLRNVGVDERSLWAKELALGVLRKGRFAELKGEAGAYWSGSLEGKAIGEGGSAVVIVVLSEKWFESCESELLSLFVDIDDSLTKVEGFEPAVDGGAGAHDSVGSISYIMAVGISSSIDIDNTLAH